MPPTVLTQVLKITIKQLANRWRHNSLLNVLVDTANTLRDYGLWTMTGTPGPAPKAGCWAATSAAAAVAVELFVLFHLDLLGAGTRARTLMLRCDMVALRRASGLRIVRVMRRQRVSQGCKLLRPSSPKAPHVPYFRADTETFCSTMWPSP